MVGRGSKRHQERKECRRYAIWHGIIVFSGGVKIANNLITTEEGFVLDARQGKALNEKIIGTKDDLLKMIQASETIYSGYDWNNYTTAGVYKVQGATMTVELHAPIGLYNYGILVVAVSQIGDEDRLLQIYYPHDVQYQDLNIILASRMCNGGEWKPWFGVKGQILSY